MATAALWSLIALAAAGGLRGLLAGVGPPASSPDTAALAGGDAGGFAQSFVAAYLEAGDGQEGSLKAYYAGPVALSGVVPSSRYVARSAVVATENLGPGYWAITVAADVLVEVPGGYERAGTSYYQTGVARSAGSFVATSLPFLVPTPAPGPLPRLQTAPLSDPPTGDLGATLARFAEAYLAGLGTLAGEVAPASGLRALTPPPFVSATVVGVGLGTVGAAPGGRQTRLAEVEISAGGAGGVTQILDYPLRLGTQGGRWVVLAVLPAPARASSRASPGPARRSRSHSGPGTRTRDREAPSEEGKP